MAKGKNREFSKAIFIGISIAAVAVAVFSCVMIWRTNDLSPLSYLIPAIFAELATATGFYYSKAKRENEIKLSKLYKTSVEGVEGDENAH